MDEISKFIQDQLSVWPLAAANFRALKAAHTRDVKVGNVDCHAQFNPCRIASTTAETDAASIAARPCFLCVSGRAKEQFHIKFEGRKDRRYNIQVNPYPIFPNHLVVARDIHTPQSIWHYFVDMMDFARKYPSYLVFYNGPYSGASAPDHMHFQAIPAGLLPLQNAVDEYFEAPGDPLASLQDAALYKFEGFSRGVYALRSKTPKSLAKLFYRLVDSAPRLDGEPEPRLNLFAYVHKGEFRCFVVLRGEQRSHHYYSTGEDHLTMTPGAADVAGMFVCPKEEDFNKLTSTYLEDMMDEVSISEKDEKMVEWRLARTQPLLDVPVLMGDEIEFEMASDGAGPQMVSLKNGKIEYCGVEYDELYFDSKTRSTLFAEASFKLFTPQGERSFAGSLKFDIFDGTIRAINHVGIENYLLSILSESFTEETDIERIEEEAIALRTRLMAAEDSPKNYKGLTIDITNQARRVIDSTWGIQKTR